jgi:hypothetical protein
MNDKRTLLIPWLLITIGAGWLLSTLGIIPGIDWIWTLGLAAVGVLAFAVFGVNKITVVVGPFFVLASGLSVLRQTGRLHFDIELPLLVMLGGALLLIARRPTISAPPWALEPANHPYEP